MFITVGVLYISEHLPKQKTYFKEKKQLFQVLRAVNTTVVYP